MQRVQAYFIIATILALAVLSSYYIHELKKTPSVAQGNVDLSNSEFVNDHVIDLDGEWEFYWNQLLEPADFTEETKRDVQYIHVPGNWLRDVEGNAYDNKGYATFRLRLNHVPEWKYYGLKKANIRNASKIYVNGKLILQDGNVSRDFKGSVAGNNSEVVYFELEDPSAEIIIQVANHEYIVGGIAKSITFGTQKVLMQQHIQKLFFEFAMILIVMIVGLFYLILYITGNHYRRKEPATLPLALSSLTFGVMCSILSERIITIFIPEITLNSTFRFGHFMNATSMIFVLLVVNKVNRRFLPDWIRNVMFIYYGIFLCFVLVLPLDIYLTTITFYMVSTIIFLIGLWLWIYSLYLKRDFQTSHPIEHGTLIVSVFSILLFWIDMMLYSLGLTTNLLVSFLTIAIYSISLATLLIMRYTASYRKNEELSIKLIETFSTLDQSAKEVQRNELAFLQAQIKPHFLFNALSSIISLCYTNGERAAKLLTDLSNYLKRSFDIDLKTEWITIENELRLIEAYVDIEKARFGNRIEVVYDIDSHVLSSRITPLIIEPLVENAIRHGVLKNKNGGKVIITIKKKQLAVYISVEDNGKGMDPAQIEAIQRGTSSKSAVSSGHGISLMNVYTRLRNLYGVKLNFESTSNGTKVYCTIPIQD